MSACIFLIGIVVSFYIFFEPYEITLKGEGNPLLFYLLSGGVFIFYVIWGIADFADANGVIRVVYNFENGMVTSGVFAVVVTVFSFAVVVLTGINVVTFYNRGLSVNVKQ